MTTRLTPARTRYRLGFELGYWYSRMAFYRVAPPVAGYDGQKGLIEAFMRGFGDGFNQTTCDVLFPDDDEKKFIRESLPFDGWDCES